MTSTLKYFFNLLFLLAVVEPAFSQVSRYAPTAVRVGADPGTFAYMLFSETRGFWEFEADMDVDRFFVVANYGLSTYKLDEETFKYTNDGSYMRLGADMNFLNKDPNLNVAFFGLRYSFSSFTDELEYNTSAIIQKYSGWPETIQNTSNSRVKANWFEMVTGLKIRVVKQLYLGFTLRYKLFMNTNGAEDLRPYYIPGFGKNIGTSSFGFNYYVSYRLPFRKKIIYTDENKNVIEEK